MPRLAAAAFASIIALSACGGGAAPAPAVTAAIAPSAAGATSADVTVQNRKFGPQSLEVKVGTKVTWTNQDNTGHTTTSGTPNAKDGKWDGELGTNGGTFSFTFAQAGTFSYFCQRHPTTMSGTIVVK